MPFWEGGLPPLTAVIDMTGRPGWKHRTLLVNSPTTGDLLPAFASPIVGNPQQPRIFVVYYIPGKWPLIHWALVRLSV